MRQRNMTKGLLVIAFLFLAAGCKEKEGGNEVTPPVGASVVPQPTGTDIEGENGRPPAADDGRKEAKMLQDLVAAKKLPPLENRIPAADDVMTEPLGTVGVYGESAQLAAADAGVMAGELVSEGLFCYAADGSIVPNIAKGYTVNADFTRYTISLREGMRWSDGVPFTSDDCVFFYEHMCVPKTFGESLWKCFLSYDAGGNASPAVFTKIDNTSFQVTFSSPKPDFLEELRAGRHLLCAGALSRQSPSGVYGGGCGSCKSEKHGLYRYSGDAPCRGSECMEYRQFTDLKSVLPLHKGGGK